MKTLKDYSDFLHGKGYKETFAPYTFLDSDLEIVEFEKNGYKIDLYVDATEEFVKYMESLEPGTEYEVDYKNYNVTDAYIESPICNISNFIDGDRSGIRLVSKPNDYNKHTLDLFEFCVEFQKVNLLEHELFIMSKRIEQLSWAKDNLVPILEKYDYQVDYDCFFNTSDQKDNSNIRLDFKHINGDELVIETDCLTGDLSIWTYSKGGCKDLAKELFGKNQDEVYDILLNEVWKNNELKYGYIYNNDPHETVDTYREVLTLMDCIHYKEKNEINFNVVPERYNYLIEQYNSL